MPITAGTNLDRSREWLFALGSRVKLALRAHRASRYFDLRDENAIPKDGSSAYLIGWLKADVAAFAGIWAYYLPGGTMDLSYGFGTNSQSSAKQLAREGDKLFPTATTQKFASVKMPALVDAPVLELRPRGESFYGIHLSSPISTEKTSDSILVLDVAQFLGRVVRTLQSGILAAPYLYQSVRGGLRIQTPSRTQALSHVRCPQCKSSLIAWDLRCSNCGWGFSERRPTESPLYESELADT